MEHDAQFKELFVDNIACDTVTLRSKEYFDLVHSTNRMSPAKVMDAWECLKIAQETSLRPIYLYKPLLDCFNTDVAARRYSGEDGRVCEVGGWLLGGQVKD